MKKEKNNLFPLIISALVQRGIKDRAALDSFKREMAKQYKIDCPNNIQLLAHYRQLVENKKIKQNEHIETLLRTRPVRSLSGIVNISVLTKPYPCPGQCLYCPTEKGVPKSYLKGEPAVQRAILNHFDPYNQVRMRLESLRAIGHPIDKVELRIIGGTWSYYSKQYQKHFIKECFRAANEFKKISKGQLENDLFSKGKTSYNLKDRFNKDKEATPHPRVTSNESLEEIEKKNEKAGVRIIGITIETRPDYINKEEIRHLRYLGITRVELGVQTVYDDILRLNRRGNDLASIIKATKLLKENGFKVSYQMMPNLLGSNLKKDAAMFEQLFSDPRLKPDLLKIYPLALIKTAPLYQEYLKNKFQPYNKEELINLLIRIKKKVPYWVRIQRIIRDIPSEKIITGGVKTSNLREVVQARMAKENTRCHCIRCREVKEHISKTDFRTMKLWREDYQAAGGKEIFLSFENKERTQLYGLLRLRINNVLGEKEEQEKIFSCLARAAIIREVHTYGQMIPVGDKSSATQHRGLGKKLIQAATAIVKKEFPGIEKIVIISGIGVRDYYRHLGYRLKESYMIKRI